MDTKTPSVSTLSTGLDSHLYKARFEINITIIDYTIVELAMKALAEQLRLENLVAAAFELLSQMISYYYYYRIDLHCKQFD
jgi:hypothetical protein